MKNLRKIFNFNLLALTPIRQRKKFQTCKNEITSALIPKDTRKGVNLIIYYYTFF